MSMRICDAVIDYRNNQPIQNRCDSVTRRTVTAAGILASQFVGACEFVGYGTAYLTLALSRRCARTNLFRDYEARLQLNTSIGAVNALVGMIHHVENVARPRISDPRDNIW